jgi:hypothetical protein
MAQVTLAKNRLGQGERPKSALVIRWTGARIANSKNAQAMRSTARTFGRGLAIAVDGDAVKLHPMVDEPET